MEHPRVRGEPSAAHAPALHHRRPRIRLSRSRDHPRRSLHRVRVPTSSERCDPPTRDGACRLPLLAPVPRAALRRDHGGQHIAPLVVSLATALAAIVYVVGVARMRRRWPLWRTALFLLGLATLLAALASPIDAYAGVSFAVHMAQHMLLTVVAAPLLLLGAPIRPLLRGLRGDLRDDPLRHGSRDRPACRRRDHVGRRRLRVSRGRFGRVLPLAR